METTKLSEDNTTDRMRYLYQLLISKLKSGQKNLSIAELVQELKVAMKRIDELSLIVSLGRGNINHILV